MRNGNVDKVRFFAAVGIVAFHAGAPGAEIGYAGLTVFTLFLAHFATARRDRVVYFLRLWLVWSLVYAVLKVADVVVGGSSWEAEFSPVMLLTGTALHLWFLPFAAVVVLVAEPMRRFVSVPVAALLALLAFYLNSGRGLPVPLAQWCFVLPPLLFGLVLARPWSLPAAVAIIPVAWGLGWTSGLLQFAIAIPVVMLAQLFPQPGTRMSNWMRDTSLGIYLIHPMAIALLLRAGVADRLLLAALAVAVSAATALALNSRLRGLV